MAYAFCGFVILATIGLEISFQQIAPYQVRMLAPHDRDRMRRIIAVLLVVPALIIVVVVGLVFLQQWPDALVNITHWLWAVGLWLVGGLAFYIFAFMQGVGLRRVYLPLLVMVIAIPGAFFTTPVQNYVAVFNGITPYLPLMVSLITLTSGYHILLFAWQHSSANV